MDTVPAVYQVDPRTFPLADMVRLATELSREVAALDARIHHNYVGVLTQLSRELFASKEGALIDQAFALLDSCEYVVGPRTRAATRPARSITSVVGR